MRRWLDHLSVRMRLVLLLGAIVITTVLNHLAVIAAVVH